MEKIKCKICEKEFTSLMGLSKHNSQKHSICSKETYIQYKLNGNKPVCQCGCGEETNYLSIKKGFVDYVRGHAARINNNWGHNPDALTKSHETQRLMHKTGQLKVWNDGLTIDDSRVRDNIDKVMANPNRSKRISKALSDVPKSEEHKQNLSIAQIKSWDNQEKRDRQRDNRMRYIRNNDLVPISKLEKYFEEILLAEFKLKSGVDYYPQFYIRDIKALFDFKLSGKKILIEVDGDYWHCNPNTKFKVPKYAAQFSNLKKDKIKKEWCDKNSYILLRFWENDINNNLDEIITKLKEFL
jgi:very-short-patch-repair endonuclease